MIARMLPCLNLLSLISPVGQFLDPRTSNTGVSFFLPPGKKVVSMLKFAVDWIAVTVKGNDNARQMHDLCVQASDREFRQTRPFNGYTDAIENRLGAVISWSMRRADMGQHVEYSGTVLGLYRASETNPLDIVRWHVSEGHTFTRLDVAIDVIDTELSPRKLYEQLQSGKAQTKGGRGYKMWEKHDGGQTLYIGSRTSNIFLRIYDKGAELHTDDVWVRVELELKGGKAREFANLIANDGSDSAIHKMRGVLRTVVAFPGKVWAGIVGDEDVKLTDSTKKTTDTEAWLLELVAPAMGKLIAKRGDNGLTEKFLETVEHWRRMSDNWQDPAALEKRDNGAKLDKTNTVSYH